MGDMSAAALGGSSGFYGGGGLEASAQAQLYAFYSNHALQNPSLLAQMQQQNAIQQQRNNYEPRVWYQLDLFSAHIGTEHRAPTMTIFKYSEVFTLCLFTCSNLFSRFSK